MNAVRSSIVALLLSALATSASAVECTTQLPPSVTVTGEGEVFTKPDQAELSIGVTSQARTAVDALQDNKAAMTALLKTLQSKGVADKDIRTSNFSVSPQYRYDSSKTSASSGPTITGYNVNNSVQTKIRNLDKVGDILDAVVSSGANNIGGISFSLAEPAPVLDEARKKAMADALRKAEIYTGATGSKLGRVIYITESSGLISPPRPMGVMAARAASVAVPISTGEQGYSASVTVTYAIESPASK